MSLREIKYADTNAFSKLLVDYSQSEKHFSKLISHFPSVDNLKKQISSKSKNYNHSFRKLLVEEIYDQYEGFKLNEIQKKNIDKLLEKNTFTITTGHQLNLLTGPLYFIYKIISVINLCENMQKNNPENNFVPVFWMASEDHDFAEINHFSFKDEKFLWPSKENGVVGEFKLESIQGTIDRFEKHIKGFNYTAEIIEIIRECYLNSVDLSNATRKLVNILFSKYGLVIIDANNKNIKTLFKDLIFKEVSEKLIHNESKQSIEILNELGYDIQANPREINLFYIEKGSRERIISTDNKGLIVKPEECDLEFQIKKSNIAINSSDARPSRFVGGERIDAAISELNIEKRKVSLSIKLLEELQNKEAVSKFSSPLSGKNLPFSTLSDKLKKKDKEKK